MVLMALSSAAFASTPAATVIEGALTSTGGGAAADGTYDMTFKIYAGASGGSAIWSEGPLKVVVSKGQFRWALGSKTPLNISKLHATKTPHLSIKIGADPELARRPLRSVIFALHAGSADKLMCTGCVSGGQIANGSIAASKVGFTYAGSTTKGGPAKDLACTGCVSVKEMKFDGGINLGGFSLKAKNGTFTGGIAAATVTATTFLGDGSKLTGIKIPSGECKTKGYVVKGINPDGSLKCVKAMDPSALPKDGLNEISNNLLSNQFTDTIHATQKMVPIPDNTGSDGVSTIAFPNIGIAQTFSMSVHFENTDLSKVAAVVLPHNDKKVGWTLCDPCGTKSQKIYKKTFTPTAKPKSGDIAKMIGTNIQGLWTLKVTDTSFCQPQIQSDLKWCKVATKSDGWIATWSIKIQTLSNQKINATGNVHVAGELKGKDNGHGTTSGPLKIGSDLSVAGNINLGGQVKVGNHALSNTIAHGRGAYSVVYLLRSPTYCPKGFNLQKFDDLRGPNNYVYVHITKGGVSIGGTNGQSYGGTQQYTRIPRNTSWNNYFCWKTFESPADNAYTSVIVNNGTTSASTCPTGYYYIPSIETRGSGDETYLTMSQNGMWMGYQNSWSYGANSYQLRGGYLRRQWDDSQTKGACVRHFGVNDGSEFEAGAFPIFMLMRNNSQCPKGFHQRTSKQMSSSNGHNYMSFIGAGHVAGTYNGWGHGGAKYFYMSPHQNNYKVMCFKMLPRRGAPSVETYTSHYNTGACLKGFKQFSLDNLRRADSSTAHMYKTDHAMVIGGLTGVTNPTDNADGWHYHYWSSYQKKLCMRLHNVSWP